MRRYPDAARQTSVGGHSGRKCGKPTGCPGVLVQSFAFSDTGSGLSRHAKPSCSAKAGHPVRRGLSIQSLPSLEYWIVRPCAQLRTRRTMTPNMHPHSRGAMRPRLDRSSRPMRAQGRPGARCTRGLVCNGTKKCAHEHTGPAESIRPSLRNGLTAYGALSPETNSFCLRHRRIDGFAKPGWASRKPPPI